MPKSHSYKRMRDTQIVETWAAMPDKAFARTGLSRETLAAAQSGLTGHIVLPTDPSYDQDRLLSNPVFDAAPCFIVYCESESDVAIALDLASQTDMPFTIRSGGHCTAGFSAGSGVLIDVSGLDDVTILPGNTQVVVGTGCQFHKLNSTLKPYNLHVPGGECDGVCIGGYVQGGGIGFTSGSFGMNCDNVLEMRVMLWDGSIVIANPQQNMDLWWAMRGGTGGNFGVLLSVTYKLSQLSSCTGWALAWPMASDADRQACVTVMETLQSQYIVPDAYSGAQTLQVLWVYQTIIDPTQPPLPAPVPVFMVRGLWIGDPGMVPSVIAPLTALPGCVTQFVQTGDYMTVLDALLNNPQEQPIVDPSLGMPNEDKSSRYVDTPIDSAGWKQILDYFVLQSPNTLSYGYLEVYGGAINSYPFEDSAFIHRNVLYNVVMDGFWYMPKDRQKTETFMYGWNQLIEKFWNGHIYQNYVSIQVPDYEQNYWGIASGMLYSIKTKYDPEERFRFAQQVRRPTNFDPNPGPVLPFYQNVVNAWAQPIDYNGGVRRN